MHRRLRDRVYESLMPMRAGYYAVSVLVVLATVGMAFPVRHLMPHANLSLLFLASVLIVSARAGLGPSLVSSLLSFLAFNYFFTSPYYTFEVADDGDVATLVFFLLMSTITGNLAARMRREMDKRRASLARISNLYDFSRRMSSAPGGDEVLDALADHLAESLGKPVAILVETSERLPGISKRAGEAVLLPERDCNRAWAGDSDEMIVSGAWNFIPLPAKQGPKTMVAIYADALDDEQIKLSKTLCDQASVALDRTRLVEDLEKTRLVSETEQLRSALLSSVSHDLRTPLATITGSATSLLEYGDSFSGKDRHDLLVTVVDGAQRLDRYIQNLLDMTRLGQGNLALHRDWVDLHDIISSAEDRMRDGLKELRIKLDISRDVPLLWVHGVLIEQALVNLLDNAVRFSPDNGQITISARQDGGAVKIDVCDEGPGVPEYEREKIFDMFYTVRDADRSALQGTGLGLAICRGMIVAHGGSVTAHEGVGRRGTCMRIDLPVIRPEGSGS